MKALLLTAVILLTMLPTVQAQTSDETIRALIAEQTAAWNHNDAHAWAKEFTDDASFINIRGDFATGRQAVEKIHAFIFAGPYKESHAVVTVESVRYPATDVAVVETVHEVTNLKGLPPGIAATSPGVLRTRMKYVLIKRDGAWKIFAAQNTAILPPPVAAH